MDQEPSFWENYEAQNTVFQEANLLDIIVNHYYITKSHNKTPFRTLSIGGKAYIQKVIIKAHLHCYFEVLSIIVERKYSFKNIFNLFHHLLKTCNFFF